MVRHITRSLMREAIDSCLRSSHKYKSSGDELLVAEYELELYNANIKQVWCAAITHILLGM